MRTGVIHTLTRKIRFEGHIGTFIGELAVVYFTGIKHTADWYLASFKENEVASCKLHDVISLECCADLQHVPAFITWTKERILEYADIFRKQVYSKDVDEQVVEEAIAITQTQSRKVAHHFAWIPQLSLNRSILQLLQEYGLDFRYLLDDILLEHPKEQSTFSSAFSFREHRMSKAGTTSTSGSLAKRLDQDQTPPILEAPPIPIISAAPPPVGVRRHLPVPPPIGNSDSLYPPPLDSIKSPSALNSSTSNSSYSGIRMDTPGSVPPLFSGRQNGNYPTRARTPVSASTPTSALVPAVPVAAPSPRPPLSATPYRSRDRSDSFRDREGLSGYRERPPRSARASPIPGSPAAPLPPRSANRPGSSMGGRTPVAVPQHDGMI